MLYCNFKVDSYALKFLIKLLMNLKQQILVFYQVKLLLNTTLKPNHVHHRHHHTWLVVHYHDLDDPWEQIASLRVSIHVHIKLTS